MIAIPTAKSPSADSPPPVGASLLAKIANDNAGCLIHSGALWFFASKLAPTTGLGPRTPSPLVHETRYWRCPAHWFRSTAYPG
ncbi:hypothetical protein BFW90_07215 [Pseudomonas fluorescens]|nr:hypothetical protein BFW90_07215 [Pseudomonas fluorescens]